MGTGNPNDPYGGNAYGQSGGHNRRSGGNDNGIAVPPPPPNNGHYDHQQQMMSSHGQHAQYANYLDQERQRHQRAQMQEAQRALQQRGPNNVQYVPQHPSVHQRQQIHKKAVKNQQPPNQGYNADAMGYGAPHNIPGANQNGMKPDGVNP